MQETLEIDSRTLPGPAWLGALLVMAVLICVGQLSTADFASRWDDRLTIQTNPRFNPPTLANIARFWPPLLRASASENLTGRPQPGDASFRVNHVYGLYAPLTYS